MKKLKETEDSRYIYQIKLYKACFQHDMAHEDFEKLTEEQLLINYCIIKQLILLKIRNMMDINEDLLQWSLDFFIKELLVVVLKMRIFQTNVLCT